jgi:hypothetical protein
MAELPSLNIREGQLSEGKWGEVFDLRILGKFCIIKALLLNK